MLIRSILLALVAVSCRETTIDTLEATPAPVRPAPRAEARPVPIEAIEDQDALIEAHHREIALLDLAPAPDVELESLGLISTDRELGRIRRKYRRFELRLTNHRDAPIHYSGYTKAHPVYATNKLVDGEWHPAGPWGWCGTGLAGRELGPGESVVFFLTPTVDDFPLRVGIGLYREPGDEDRRVVWSETVDLR